MLDPQGRLIRGMRGAGPHNKSSEAMKSSEHFSRFYKGGGNIKQEALRELILIASPTGAFEDESLRYVRTVLTFWANVLTPSVATLVVHRVSPNRALHHESKRVEAVLAEERRTLSRHGIGIPQLAWRARPMDPSFGTTQRWYEYTGTTSSNVRGGLA